MKNIFLLSLALVALPAWATEPSLFMPSQVREVGEDYTQALERYMVEAAATGARLVSRDSTAQGEAVPLAQLDLSTVPDWGTESELLENFAIGRDDRWLTDPQRPEFERRPTWLFPDDGCYARAALVSRKFRDLGLVRPKKLFAFGNLRVTTANSPKGAVWWWYHVVPVVSVDGEAFVIDPAVDPSRPLRVREWVSLISSNPEEVELSVCAPTAYEPSNSCQFPSATADSEALRDQRWYFPKEWNRLIALGRDPTMELGDNPPWKQ